ncbi:uncharacterized protein LOC117867221 [Trachemys scripta elegans]|uniref:uncharacterized protein LOC117867221 n=1 Tax=Trachemys scripta elegans TaxID=31138 RepID=UPI0015574DDD|nr:uncharacterized protein LOC117867221 [Trachemys scripta elegans]
MPESVSPSAPPPPQVSESTPPPPVGLYPLITESVVACPGTQERPAQIVSVYSHVPFNPVHLAAFKAEAGEFSTNPSKFISIFEGCLASHKPDWDDCNILMRTLLSEVERNQVIAKAREEAQKRYDEDREGKPLPDVAVPLVDPRWNPNEEGDLRLLNSYKELLMHGLRHSAVRQVFPLVWASGVPGKANRQTPVHIQLLTEKSPVRIKQYPIKREAREGLQETIDQFLECGVLRECQSAWNTPILPIQKPNGTYRLVQDLRAVNERVKTLYPLVPNPYTLLASIGGQYTHFSVLDLKDAFFTIPVDIQSQEIFSFEWEDKRRVKKQLCWTVLAQGFKNSPTLFGQALARDLEEWDNSDRTLLLQYVDDLLIAAVGLIPCLRATVSLLNFIGLRGYRVSQYLSEVQYLGFHIRQGERQLSNERKEAIC